MAEETAGRDPTNSKVGRVIEEYGLGDAGAELERNWTGANGRRYSLRELADRLNTQTLRTAMEDAGMSPLDGEVANTYRLLTDDDISAGMRTQARSHLEREGVDVDGVTADFVSHQAVHTYLTRYRGVEHASQAETTEQREKDAETLERLRSRTTAVTRNTLDRLGDAGDVTLGEFDVLVDVRVRCADCGTQSSVAELLDAGGCACGNGSQ